MKALLEVLSLAVGAIPGAVLSSRAPPRAAAGAAAPPPTRPMGSGCSLGWVRSAAPMPQRQRFLAPRRIE